jgi:hypothetical protein
MVCAALGFYILCWSWYLEIGSSSIDWVRVPIRWILFNLPNRSSRTMALGSTQPLTEMSTRNFPGGKERLARKADYLTVICEPIV